MGHSHQAKDKLMSVDLGELWRYRDLCMLLVKRNIYTSYKQTVLGPVTVQFPRLDVR